MLYNNKIVSYHFHLKIWLFGMNWPEVSTFSIKYIIVLSKFYLATVIYKIPYILVSYISLLMCLQYILTGLQTDEQKDNPYSTRKRNRIVTQGSHSPSSHCSQRNIHLSFLSPLAWRRLRRRILFWGSKTCRWLSFFTSKNMVFDLKWPFRSW